MKRGLDRYVNLNSPIHRWEQRSKLVALIALIFAFAFVDRLILLPPMILVTATLYRLSKLPLGFLLHRLHYPGLFILAVIVVLPFASGTTVLFEIGPLPVKQEGVEAVLLIATRFLCILTVSLILFGTAPFMTSVQAMRSLRLPEVIADMTLLAYRYLEEFSDTQKTMRRAMQMRGFDNRFSVKTIRILSGLAGSLLIRSYDRSERVYQAMRLRGYGGSLSRQSEQEGFVSDLYEADRNSQIAFWSVLLVATGFVAAEAFL
ncbi:MAG: cobalt ECF transporter T component CbiQ [Cyanophyceae cyanobacterium]